MTGAVARQYASAKIRKYGQQVVVQRPSTGAEANLYCLGMRDNVGTAALMAEGGGNAEDAQSHLFVFEWNADIAVKDLIPWQGSNFRVSQVQPTVLIGSVISKTAYASKR